jgi:TRAP-type uncharacterized transport system substrate-binding protein
MAETPKDRVHPLAAPFVDLFGLSREVAISIVLGCGLIILFAVFWFVHSAPPKTITITSGAPGSSFETNAVKYQAKLAAQGVTLKIVPSQGSIENLRRLNNPKEHFDIGFVQGGITNNPSTNTLVSLGSITYEPLLIFYRGTTPVNLLSAFAGKRIAVGAHGSGTRSLALHLLALNGLKITNNPDFADLDGDAAAAALMKGEVEAVFLMGDTTSGSVMRKLEQTPGIQLFDFTQADAYTRRISYVNKLVFPQGSIDFGKNIPARDVNLIGPTVELIARPNLHPAIIDMLIEVAQDVHGAPGIFKRRGEFPADIEHDFPMSPEASRYYKNGKSWVYRFLPFWLASRVNTVLVALVPLIVLFIPAMRLIPAAFKWRMQLRINRWYRELLALERTLPAQGAPPHRDKILNQLGRIESEVNKLKVPTSFAGQFYDLRGNILFVRNRLAQTAPSK